MPFVTPCTTINCTTINFHIHNKRELRVGNTNNKALINQGIGEIGKDYLLRAFGGHRSASAPGVAYAGRWKKKSKLTILEQTNDMIRRTLFFCRTCH